MRMDENMHRRAKLAGTTILESHGPATKASGIRLDITDHGDELSLFICGLYADGQGEDGLIYLGADGVRHLRAELDRWLAAQEDAP